MIAPKAPRKLSMKGPIRRSRVISTGTRPTSRTEEMFPYTTFEGIKIHDWSKWEDPFRLTVDAYQVLRRRRTAACTPCSTASRRARDTLSLTDASYLNAMKLFLQGVSPLEYQRTATAYLAGTSTAWPAVRVLCQSLDEIRHAQTEIHTLSNYNKYYTASSSSHQHDRVWYLSVPKSFFDDALSAGPFEFLIAIGFVRVSAQ